MWWRGSKRGTSCQLGARSSAGRTGRCAGVAGRGAERSARRTRRRERDHRGRNAPDVESLHRALEVENAASIADSRPLVAMTPLSRSMRRATASSSVRRVAFRCERSRRRSFQTLISRRERQADLARELVPSLRGSPARRALGNDVRRLGGVCGSTVLPAGVRALLRHTKRGARRRGAIAARWDGLVDPLPTSLATGYATAPPPRWDAARRLTTPAPGLGWFGGVGRRPRRELVRVGPDREQQASAPLVIWRSASIGVQLSCGARRARRGTASPCSRPACQDRERTVIGRQTGLLVLRMTGAASASPCRPGACIPLSRMRWRCARPHAIGGPRAWRGSVHRGAQSSPRRDRGASDAPPRFRPGRGRSCAGRESPAGEPYLR
jgi:hypothetical protein